ncbi:PH domain-containing protein [Haloparvum sp. PAK95]|uniref:PH domain-containing protein n=1 Tax=Haloparvum sp. PAK95 TaxID=3418962 RepID=UPI003D2EFF35
MKLSPLTVPYRAVQKVSSLLIAAFFLGTSGTFPREFVVAGAGLGLLASVAYETAYYRRFEYDLTEDTFDIASGVVTRRNREIPYRRIQNVDVSRNVVQRLLGIAAVDLETAGGSSTEGSIRYVTAKEATRLQEEIPRRKARDTEAGGEAGGMTEAEAEADAAATGEERTRSESDRGAETLFAIDPKELALVGALSFDARLVGLLLFLGSGSVPAVSGLVPDISMLLLTATGLLLGSVLLLGSWLLGAAVTVSNYWGFRLSRVGDELRYERGLFRRFSGSIPTEKVQSLTISDNPAKRLLGYASLTIETAGYTAGQGESGGSQSAVPLARVDRVRDLARTVESFGEPEFTRPPGRIRVRYAFRYALLAGLVTAVAGGVHAYFGLFERWYAPLALIALTPVAAHYKWKHRGFWLGPDHLVTRSGFWRRETKVVPYYRLQTVIDSRTVFQRRWDVATVVADTAGSGSLVGRDAVAYDVEEAVADYLHEELTEQLQRSLQEQRERRRGGDRSATDEEAVDDEANYSAVDDEKTASDSATSDEESGNDTNASNGLAQ